VTTEVPKEALDLIGVRKERRIEVTERDIKRFAQAIGDENPLYHDAAHAKATRHGSIVAPPLFGHAFAFEDTPVEQLPPDGSPIEIDVPIPAHKAVGGGSVYETFRRIAPGEELIVRSMVKDVYAKHGKSGELFFIVVETAFYDSDDALVARETATFIKRK
jgi:acyl dehydratase